MGERGSQKEEVGEAAPVHTLAALPCSPEFDDIAHWPVGVGDSALSPQSPQVLGEGSTHRARAGSAAQCPLQVAVEDLLCPLQVLGNFQPYSLASLLVGVDCEGKGVTRTHPCPHSGFTGLGLQGPLPALCTPSIEQRAYF